MTIMEASERSGISRDMIRYYEKIGLVTPGRRKNRYRNYSEDDLNILVLIRMLSNCRVPLRQIREAFQGGNVDLLLDAFQQEVKHVHRLRSELEIRERALQMDLSCFRQYGEGRKLELVHYPSRWYLRNNASSGLTQVLRAICDEDRYFYYAASLTAKCEEEKIEIALEHKGIILYSEYADAELIPEQDCLRSVLTHPAGMTVGERELAPIIAEACRLRPRSSYRILGCQIFHKMGDQEQCVVCTEVLLGNPSA